MTHPTRRRRPAVQQDCRPVAHRERASAPLLVDAPVQESSARLADLRLLRHALVHLRNIEQLLSAIGALHFVRAQTDLFAALSPMGSRGAATARPPWFISRMDQEARQRPNRGPAPTSVPQPAYGDIARRPATTTVRNRPSASSSPTAP